MLLNTGDSLWSDRWETLRQRKVFGVIFTPALLHMMLVNPLPLSCSLLFLWFGLYVQNANTIQDMIPAQPCFGLFGLIALTIRTDLLTCHVIIDFRSKSMYAHEPFLVLEQTVPSVLHLCNQLWTFKKRLKSEALSSVTNKRGRLTKCVHSSLMERNHQLL